MELQVQVTVTVDSELELSSWNLSSSQSHTKLDPAESSARSARSAAERPFTDSEDSSHGGPTVYRHGDSTVTG